MRTTLLNYLLNRMFPPVENGPPMDELLEAVSDHKKATQTVVRMATRLADNDMHDDTTRMVEIFR